MSTPDPDGYRLAYEEAKRTLDDQLGAVAELRTRAGGLIAAAAIATSFFGGQALHGHVRPLAWIAIGCFVGLSLAVLVILWPRHDWEFNLSPATFVATYLEPVDDEPVALPAIHRDLALHMGRSARLNRSQLRLLTVAFRAGAVLLVAQTVAWVAVLISQS